MSDLPRVKLGCSSGHGRNGSISIDGHNLPGVTRVDVSVDVRQANHVTVNLLAREGLDVELQSQVTVNVTAMPGYELLIEEGDGVRRYRTIKASLKEVLS